MFCFKCGKEIPDNSTFCQFCGVAQAVQQHAAPVSDRSPETEADQAAFQSTYAPPVTSDAPKKKGKMPLIIIIAVALILAIALTSSLGQIFSNNGTAELPNFISEILNSAGLGKESVHTWRTTSLFETIEQEYYCKGDKVETFTQVVSMQTDVLHGIISQPFIQQSKELGERIHAEYPFIEYSLETIDGKMIETYKINDVSDHITELEHLKAMYPEEFTFPIDSDYVSYEQVEKTLRIQGFTEVQ